MKQVKEINYEDIGRKYLGKAVVLDDLKQGMHIGDWVEVTRGISVYPAGDKRIGRRYEIVPDGEVVTLKNGKYKEKYEGEISAQWYLVRCKVIECSHK